MYEYLSKILMNKIVLCLGANLLCFLSKRSLTLVSESHDAVRARTPGWTLSAHSLLGIRAVCLYLTGKALKSCQRRDCEINAFSLIAAESYQLHCRETDTHTYRQTDWGMISSVKAVRMHSLCTEKTKTAVELDAVTKPHIAVHATRPALCFLCQSYV